MSMKAENSAKAIGRPRKYATDIQRQVVAFRVNSTLHADMLETAQKADLSLSELTEEAVRFYLENGPPKLGRDHTKLGNFVATISSAIGREVGGSWTDGTLAASYFFRRLSMTMRTLMGAVDDTTHLIAEGSSSDNKLFRAAMQVRPAAEIEDLKAILEAATQDELAMIRKLDVSTVADWRAEADEIPSDAADIMSTERPAPKVRPATPDEIAGMVPARGQLPPSIGDRALFDDAVSGLPLVKAEKATEAKHGRKRVMPPDDDVPSPAPAESQATPKRRRMKATA